MPRSVPNYLTIDPNTGAVGATFSGKVAAKGVLLDDGITSFSPSNGVLWHPPSIPINSRNYANAGADIRSDDTAGGANRYTLWLEGGGTGGTGHSPNDVVQIGPGTIGGIVNGTNPFTIMDSNGRSSFLRKLAVQRVWGQSNLYLGPFSGLIEPLPIDGGSTQFLRVSQTPSVDAWWFVTMTVGLVQKMDAAYGLCYFGLHLTPLDMDSVSVLWACETQHSQVNQFSHRTVSALFRLAAGTTYTVQGAASPGAGSWTYYGGPDYLHMTAILFQQ